MTFRSGGRLASRPRNCLFISFSWPRAPLLKDLGFDSSAPHRPAPNRGVIAHSNKAPCSALRCPAAQLSSAPPRSASSAERSAVLSRALPSRSFGIMISKPPLALIFRYLALYSISRFLCGHFVLSKTEHGVFSTLESSRAQDSRRAEARLFAPSRPRLRAA